MLLTLTHAALRQHPPQDARRRGWPAWVAMAVVFSGMAVLHAQPADEPPTIRLSPETIEMGSFYNGARVRVEGAAPAGSQVMVIVRGAAKDEVFNRKGRVGPIWINVDKVHIGGAPSLFLRFSSVDVHTILDRKTIDRYGLDELSVVERMHARTSRGEPDAQYRELIENSYIELKKKQGTYRRVADRVHIAEGGGAVQYSVEFSWPKGAPPGSYNVEVYALRQGAVVGQTATVLRLVEVGFPAYMVALANEHPWKYGLLAVIAAVMAGFGIDAIASRLRPRRVAVPKVPVPAAEPAKVAKAAAAGNSDHVVRH